MVNVTLCQAPSANAEPYGRSLASFEYEADTTKAFVIHLSLFFPVALIEFSKRFPPLEATQWQAPIRIHTVNSEVAPKGSQFACIRSRAGPIGFKHATPIAPRVGLP